MDNVVSFGSAHRIVGTWKHCDGFSDIEFTFTLQNSAVEVSVLDTDSGERPDVLAVEWLEHELALRFAVHWGHGRLIKYHFALAPNQHRGQVTMTSTYQELWERQ